MEQAHISAYPNVAYSPTEKSGTLEAERGVWGGSPSYPYSLWSISHASFLLTLHKVINLLVTNQLWKNTSLVNASSNQAQDSPSVLDQKLYLSSNKKKPYLLVVGA